MKVILKAFGVLQREFDAPFDRPMPRLEFPFLKPLKASMFMTEEVSTSDEPNIKRAVFEST